jgi:hypothetical protein
MGMSVNGCSNGTVWARFAQMAHRMLPPLGGTSVLRQSIPLLADVSKDAERLIRASRPQWS